MDKKVKAKLSRSKKNWHQILQRYKEYKAILDGRNSFSKTDHDATFMRMKGDHMSNSQLKAGYNVQLSTHNQFIVNYSQHSDPADTKTLIAHLKEFEWLYKKMLDVVVADAGYGSEENYLALEAAGVEAYIKYNSFDRQAKTRKPNLFIYDEDNDSYRCAGGRVLKMAYKYQKKTSSGFIKDYVRYEADDCCDCQLREECCRGMGNRNLDVNYRLERIKAKVHQRLTSDKGKYYRKRRGIEVESVFGNIKQNKGFRRFMLRGMSKTQIEIGLIAIAHNIIKIAA